MTEPWLAGLTWVMAVMLVGVTYLGGGPDAILAVLPLALLVGFLLAGRFPGEELLAQLRDSGRHAEWRRSAARSPLPRANPVGVSLPLVLLATARALRAPPLQGAPSLI